MKAKRFVNIAFLVLTALSFALPCEGIVVTFDDLSEMGTGSFIPNGYQGLTWTNIGCINAILLANRVTNGDYYGMVTLSNVAQLATGSEIDSPGTNFDFVSAYLTGAWNSNLNIEVEGFNGTNLLYDTTVVAGATNPTLFTFNYLNIDHLCFNSYGGESAGFPFSDVNPSNVFSMDNFDFEFVPEPSALLLTTAGALTLWAFLKRKRVT